MAAASLSRRSAEPEWMDGDDVPQETYAAVMADLATVNTLTLARRPTLDFVSRALAGLPADAEPLVIDVGFGAGDMLRAIARRLARRGRAARLVGIDLNPRSAPAAIALTEPGLAIEWHTGDAFAWPQGDPPALVLSSLVTHHMSDGEVIRFLRWMEQTATRGWFINDLHRHALALHGFRLLAATMRWHPMVRHDGAVSVARSFRRGDWERLLEEAGLAGTSRLRWRFPFRHCVERIRP